MNGSIHSDSKATQSQDLTRGIHCPPNIADLCEDHTRITDGQARVIALGKPQESTTFGDMADIFVRPVRQGATKHNRVDVVFHRYYNASIKGGTRRRRVERRHVQLLCASC